MVETLRQLNVEVLEHPPYSRNVVPSDFHLFGPLKDAFGGHLFASDKQMKEAVHVWLVTQPKTFFFWGNTETMNRWTVCVEKEGGYV